MDIKKFPFLQKKKKDTAVILGQLLDNLQPMLNGPPLSNGIPLWVLIMQNSNLTISSSSCERKWLNMAQKDRSFFRKF